MSRVKDLCLYLDCYRDIIIENSDFSYRGNGQTERIRDSLDEISQLFQLNDKLKTSKGDGIFVGMDEDNVVFRCEGKIRVCNVCDVLKVEE